MLPAFHRDAVARQTALMAEIAAANIAKWPVDTEFPVAPKMSEITLEVILRTVIGASDPARLAALREVMPKLLNVTPWASLAIAKPEPAAARARGAHFVATSTKPTACCMPRSPTAEPIPNSPRAPTRWRCWSVRPTRTAAR